MGGLLVGYFWLRWWVLLGAWVSEVVVGFGYLLRVVVGLVVSGYILLVVVVWVGVVVLGFGYLGRVVVLGWAVSGLG